MATMKELQAIESLLHYVEMVNPEDSLFADYMETVYHYLLDEYDVRNAEKAVRSEEAEARAKGMRLADRREYRRQILAAVKAGREEYPKWKYKSMEVA